jgi:leader peptidase (prepilin peptidase) / N-methyltransferase
MINLRVRQARVSIVALLCHLFERNVIMTKTTQHSVAEMSAGHTVSSAFVSAWQRSGTLWRVSAVGTIAIAILGSMSPVVPAASGAATALLVAAALVDVHDRRLPNTIVVTAAATFVIVLVIEISQGTAVRPAHVALGSAVMSGPLLMLHLLSPPSMGFGDVKFAAILGAVVGAVDWQLTISALALAAGGTATVGILRRSRTIAFGPGLVAAAAMCLAAPTMLLPRTDSTSTRPVSADWSAR